MGASQKTAGRVCARQHPVSGGAKEKERIKMSYQYLLTLCLILASTKVLSIATGRLQLPQVVGSLLAGLLLGGRLGAISVGAYAVLGLLGLPIFTEGGGFWYLLKPSFGYILGFIVGAYVTGKMAAKTSNFWHILGANLVGLIIVYGMGMVYYYIICNFVLGTPIGLWPLVLYCFLLAVPGDLCLCVLAAAVTVRLRVALPGLSRA